MPVTVITCSGVSNTGKLTTQAGSSLMHRCNGKIEACIAATRPRPLLEDDLRHANRILVLDGCSDCCGKKRLISFGIEPHLHIIATECGIKKNGMGEPKFDEIELLTKAVFEAIRDGM